MPEILVPDAPGVMKCSICGREFEKELLIVDDPDLCRECRKTYGGLASVYCNRCGKVVARVPPGLTDSGYVVKPRQTLHVRECPGCNPLAVETVPEEVLEYEKGR